MDLIFKKQMDVLEEAAIPKDNQGRDNVVHG